MNIKMILKKVKNSNMEKIGFFKRQAERYVSDIDKAIEDFSHCTGK